MNKPASNPGRYDVVIIGGALAGAASAILLLRKDPRLKILIIEKSSVFGRRVGEATVEVSGYFLCRVLGLTAHLNESHLVKQGMRFWFFNERTRSLAECGEVGGRYLSRVPAFQVDRSSLDEEVLRRAACAGAEVLRPAAVRRVILVGGGEQEIQFRRDDTDEKVTARWVIDASGVGALLARQQGWFQPNAAHPTTAAWARWSGVKDWDDYELAQKYPDWAKSCYGLRNTATNHLVGPGWWAWLIPLKGGDVSVGVVFDQRFVDWPQEGSVGQRMKDFLLKHPAGREIMGDAQWRENDVHWRKNLPYCSTTFAGDGFVLVGDAAAFIDPLYSPGMDWVTFTVSAAVELISGHRKEGDLRASIDWHNRQFTRSYERWFEAIYRDKYEYLGEFDLMRIAFLLDLGFYYGGVASQPFKRGTKALIEPVFSTAPSIPFYYLIKAYNRRLARIARRRRSRGELGRRNHCRRMLIPGFNFSTSSAWPIVKSLGAWAKLEMLEGWKCWFSPCPSPALARTPVTSAPVPAAQGAAKS
jgi:flavin-dependent dehydrogenase